MAEQGVPDGFKRAQFAKGFLDRAGPYWLKKHHGSTIIGLRIDETHDNNVGAAHGGVLATLADVAMSFQVHDSERPQLGVVTNSLTCNFLDASRRGDWIEAHTRIDRMGGRIAYTSGEIICGDKRLLTMSGVFTILRKS